MKSNVSYSELSLLSAKSYRESAEATDNMLLKQGYLRTAEAAERLAGLLREFDEATPFVELVAAVSHLPEMEIIREERLNRFHLMNARREDD